MADEESVTEFDLEQLDDETRTKVEGLLDEKVSGLKRNAKEVTGQLRTARERSAALEAQVQGFTEALGGVDLADVRELIEARENGDTQKLLGEKKFDEAFDLKLKKERSRWEREASKAADTLTTERDAALSELGTLKERVKVMSLDEKSVQVYQALPNAEVGAASTVAEQVRKVFTLDEDGSPVALDESGEPRTIRGTNKLMTIEHYVTEVLPETMPFLYRRVEGSGAKGSRGASHNGFGSGITSRKGADAKTRSTFMQAARSAGKNPLDEWNKLPSD